jgi:hypothetical protein
MVKPLSHIVAAAQCEIYFCYQQSNLSCQNVVQTNRLRLSCSTNMYNVARYVSLEHTSILKNKIRIMPTSSNLALYFKKSKCGAWFFEV